ncbi:MAG: hypothetical protein IPG59_14840 [Candidatus Melainabacteria bacterium]|nr:MAG: hypothetical protein IPG59_14840 [Candidatus Melainabacteria bacterium]
MNRLFAFLNAMLFLVFFGTGQFFCVCEAQDPCGGLQNVFASAQADNATFHAVQHSCKIANQDCCDHCQSGDASASSINPNSSEVEQIAFHQRDDVQLAPIKTQFYQQHLGRAPPLCGHFNLDKIFLAKGSLLV